MQESQTAPGTSMLDNPLLYIQLEAVRYKSPGKWETLLRKHLMNSNVSKMLP